MKLIKMSLAAALLAGSSAFAIENTKVSGDAKLFYSTDDAQHVTASGIKDSMFDQDTSMGEASLNLTLSTDLTDKIKASATFNAISTLGLYNNLVAATWTGGIQDNYFFSEAWLAATEGKTTFKAGRMLLDTPLVFSETWSVVPNSFEAAVVMNQDLPDTTLVGAYVGQHNSAATVAGVGNKTMDIDVDGDTVGDDARSNIFESFYNGAYAFGVVNNSWKPLTAQAWYYSAHDAVTAYWLQADLECQLVEGISYGLQFTETDYDKVLLGSAQDSSNDAFAVKVAYEMKDTFAVSVAYSQTGKDSKNGAGAGANLATGAQSKLYTEAWWYYGKITQNDTTAYNLTVTAPVGGFDLGVYATSATAKNGIAVGKDDDFLEVTLEVAKSFGDLDAGVYYIYTDSDSDNVDAITGKGKDYGTAQVYLTYNF
ncbi:outer membrane porin, OprD family [Sulfurimonas lithotrophica]|uniref:Outer membrane porin, OprD family n=1 Tax=Sulfurimonas lithotrophica TaxID=2590022 RepID=A0A5P8P2R7_9BACT|nr:OprD family outer membrane porin [Sulfurimonas lithotrophica]QFR49965.1 outer membrane porin, OprD family [Sulfurimonas lithotrophica]